MNYLIKDTTLTAIGDAVRAKGNTEDKILVSDLATAISNLPSGGGGGVEVEPIVLTGDCDYACVGAIAAKYLKNFGNIVSTNEITNANNMFYKSTLEHIPFALNFKSTSKANLGSLFEHCEQLKEIPAINNVYPNNISYLFGFCWRIRYLPEDLGTTWNWNELNSYNYANLDDVFYNCYSLRKIPEYFLSNLWGKQKSSSYIPYKGMFYYCVTLDEVNNVPIHQATITSNTFSSTFNYCNRIKNFTFATNEDGTAKTANWKSQTIDLTYGIGWVTTEHNVLNYNSGITADKKVKDDATYQALKNDPDWFSCDINYSRYNHDSAVNTINSLPDCSAYLATAGGTNTIKFKGQAGSKTDGGAINTLTEEEIAVAAAKGWTVSFA